MNAYLDLLFVIIEGHEGAAELGARLPWNNVALVASLGNKERGTIRLATALDGSRAIELAQLKTALRMHPLNTRMCADKHFELCHLDLIVPITDGGMFVARLIFSNLCIRTRQPDKETG